MDAHLFRLFLDNLFPLLQGCRIGKIQEPAPNFLVIGLERPGWRKQFCLRFGRRDPFCFLAEERISANAAPPAPVMRLRRHFSGRLIGGMESSFLERRLWLLRARKADETQTGKAAWLCLDLARGASIHFLDPDETPQSLTPHWPDRRQLPQALENWRQWPVLTPPLRRTIAMLDEPDQAALLEDLRQGGGDVFLYAGASGTISGAYAWPLAPAQARGLALSVSASPLEALAAAGRDLVLAKIGSAEKQGQKEIRKLKKILNSLELDQKRLMTMIARGEDAEALRASLWRWPDNPRLAEFHIDQGGNARRIPLDPRLTVRENMERLFHHARRARRGIAMIEDRRQKILGRLSDLEAGAAPATGKSQPAPPVASGGQAPKNVRIFTSSDGYAMLRGANARGNQALRKLAAPHDLWTHVESGPGAHVVIRRRNRADTVPESTLEEAGALAAEKSWLAESDSAPVMYAELGHIKPARGGPAGKVTIDKIQFTRMIRDIHAPLARIKPKD